LSLSNAGSNNVQFLTGISDGDLLFKGVDGGSVITALTLDMSAAGAATFNSSITSGGNITVGGTNNLIINDSGALVVGNNNDVTISNTGSVFNEDGQDADFRIESSGDNKAFFVNGGDGVVSFGGMGDNTRNPSGVTPKFQANSLTRMDSSISLCCNSNDSLASLLMFSKTRSANLTGNTAAQAGDAVGAITWNAADGTDIECGIAAIDAVVESGIGSNDTPGALRFYTNSGTTSASERVRITGGGRVVINDTAAIQDSMFSIKVPNSVTANAIVIKPTSNATINAVLFENSSGSNSGFIQYNSSSTTYATSSDYRMKENVVALSGATDRLKQLNPSRFNFIEDADTTVDGFLAHEVQAVVPEAVTGTKDAVDADGNPEYQGIDQSKLVPLLVATIQELEARIAALESE